MIHCISLHRHENEEVRDFIDNEEVLELYKERVEEIELALSKHKRVYFLCELEHNYAGVFHSVHSKQLSSLLSKAGNDPFSVSEKVLKVMACSFADLEMDTRKEIINIISEKDTDIPAGIVLSLSNILLQKEGIGLAEAGK